jgi:hypothetical protein
MRKLVYLSAVLAAGSAALAWDLSGTSQSKLWSAQPGNAMSLAQVLDLRAWGTLNNDLELEAFLRYELDHEAWEDTARYLGISKKSLKLNTKLGSATVGDFQAVLGKGLVLNCVEERRTGTDRDLEGADFSAGLGDLLELRVLGGWLREYAVRDTSRMVAGGQVGIGILRGLRIGAVYLRSNAALQGQAGVLGMPVEEIFGGTARAGFGPLEAYAEFDVRHTYGRLVDATAGWTEADDIKGQAGFASVSLALPGLGLALEAKDYRDFNAGFNAPPPANRDGGLLNAGYDEQGFQAEATASPWSGLTVIANHSWARSRHEYRWAYLPQFPGDSLGRFKWRDYYLEAKWQAGAGLSLGAEARARLERNLQPDIKLRYFRGGSAEATFTYGQSRSATFGFGADQFRNHYIDRDLEFYSLTAQAKWSPLGLASIFGEAELCTKRLPEYDDQKRWGEAGIDLAWGQDRYHLKLSAGQTKGGLVCSGGFCRYEPSFRGLKASWEWKF